MKSKLLTTLVLAALPGVLLAQAPNPADEGGAVTQALLRAQSKDGAKPTMATTKIEVDGHSVPLAGLSQVQPGNAEVALLIDDGLSRQSGIQLPDMRDFVNSLPPATDVFVGYMMNGRVVPVAGFTTDHARAAKAIRLPTGLPGSSGSPYIALSDFLKRWPTAGGTADLTRPQTPGAPLKARFVLMVTNGVDPYNGSVSLLNQNSPYVQNAARDAERAGVPVYSIYYSDSAFRSGAASFSGQSYLQQVADETGGKSFYMGTINPVSLKPYFKEFRGAVQDSYIATFPAGTEAPSRPKLLSLKVSTLVKGLKLHAANAVMPGNLESTVRQ